MWLHVCFAVLPTGWWLQPNSVWMSCPVLAHRPEPFKLKLRFWASRELHPLSLPALDTLTQSSAKWRALSNKKRKKKKKITSNGQVLQVVEIVMSISVSYKLLAVKKTPIGPLYAVLPNSWVATPLKGRKKEGVDQGTGILVYSAFQPPRFVAKCWLKSSRGVKKNIQINKNESSKGVTRFIWGAYLKSTSNAAGFFFSLDFSQHFLVKTDLNPSICCKKNNK